jgi:hypothetical protein
MPEHDAQGSQWRNDAHDGCEKKEPKKKEIDHCSAHIDSRTLKVRSLGASYSVAIGAVRQGMSEPGTRLANMTAKPGRRPEIVVQRPLPAGVISLD